MGKTGVRPVDTRLPTGTSGIRGLIFMVERFLQREQCDRGLR